MGISFEHVNTVGKIYKHVNSTMGNILYIIVINDHDTKSKLNEMLTMLDKLCKFLFYR